MPIEILMPALSPTMEKGNLTKWMKNIGDRIKSGDVVAEIETDKATMEFEAVDEGYLAKIFVEAGTKDVPVNKPIFLLIKNKADIDNFHDYVPGGSNLEEIKTSSENKPITPDIKTAIDSVKITNSIPQESNNRVIASPIAKRLAYENNVNLNKISGSGPLGRIVKSDIIHALETPTSNIMQPINDAIKRIEITGMRRVIAERLTFSKSHIPHFYLKISCMMDELLKMREKINKSNEKFKITVNDIIVKIVAHAMKMVPEMNVSWRNDFIEQYNDIDICVAVAIEGGLITPIVKNADQISLSMTSTIIKELILKAKEGKLKPHEFQGGSITISNLGMFDIDEFSAIINSPQASILAIGSTKKIPIVINDEIKIASMMNIMISADHRVVDGATAARFLKEIKNAIENPILFLI